MLQSCSFQYIVPFNHRYLGHHFFFLLQEFLVSNSCLLKLFVQDKTLQAKLLQSERVAEGFLGKEPYAFIPQLTPLKFPPDMLLCCQSLFFSIFTQNSVLKLCPDLGYNDLILILLKVLKMKISLNLQSVRCKANKTTIRCHYCVYSHLKQIEEAQKSAFHLPVFFHCKLKTYVTRLTQFQPLFMCDFLHPQLSRMCGLQLSVCYLFLST